MLRLLLLLLMSMLVVLVVLVVVLGGWGQCLPAWHSHAQRRLLKGWKAC
jgi:hypothetical protein